MQQTIEAGSEADQDPNSASSYWEFELSLAETEDPEIGLQDGHSLSHPKIKKMAEPLTIKIDANTARFIGGTAKHFTNGFHQDDDGKFYLDFDYTLTSWSKGILHYWKVKIPKGGYFISGRKTTAYIEHQYDILGGWMTAADYDGGKVGSVTYR